MPAHCLCPPLFAKAKDQGTLVVWRAKWVAEKFAFPSRNCCICKGCCVGIGHAITDLWGTQVLLLSPISSAELLASPSHLTRCLCDCMHLNTRVGSPLPPQSSHPLSQPPSHSASLITLMSPRRCKKREINDGESGKDGERREDSCVYNEL